MNRNKIFLLSVEELEKYPTKRLLARLKSLNQCEESFELSDREESERNLNPEIIEFKLSEEWQVEHKKLKEILKNREHILRQKNKNSRLFAGKKIKFYESNQSSRTRRSGQIDA